MKLVSTHKGPVDVECQQKIIVHFCKRCVCTEHTEVSMLAAELWNVLENFVGRACR
jgi:hypothetical protein